MNEMQKKYWDALQSERDRRDYHDFRIRVIEECTSKKLDPNMVIENVDFSRYLALKGRSDIFRVSFLHIKEGEVFEKAYANVITLEFKL